ncbi:unnamed protein product [Darwinula stevensoni]|uniref:Uncharacterized protein n=1 Tax=Darwinula stevensoni TaxID=69355 RepID=A0A7R9FS31_9CRUS|nr:unnamed protein product [Darwinula stevensoni]CAG0902944.1 unnamed protein product [Darwinula stevensoni]
MGKKAEKGKMEKGHLELLSTMDYGIPGFSQLFGFIPAHPTKRILWATIFLLCLSITVYQVTSFFSEYASWPVTKKFDWAYQGTAPFPSITLCNENSFKPKVVKEYLKSGVVMSSYPIKDWDFKHFKDGQEILNAINRSFLHLEDALQGCLLSGKPCSDVGWWTEKVTESQGLCHTFQPDPNKPMPTGGGRLKGYILNFTDSGDWFCDSKDPICGHVQDSGWQIFLNEGMHTDRDAVWNDEVIQLASGETRRYRVLTTEETLLNRPGFPCFDRNNFSTTLNCLETCLYRNILGLANVTCWPYWMPTLADFRPRPCGTEQEYQRIWLVSGKLLESDIAQNDLIDVQESESAVYPRELNYRVSHKV